MCGGCLTMEVGVASPVRHFLMCLAYIFQQLPNNNVGSQWIEDV